MMNQRSNAELVLKILSFSLNIHDPGQGKIQLNLGLIINQLLTGGHVPHRARDGPSRLQEQQEGGEIPTRADFHSVVKRSDDKT